MTCKQSLATLRRHTALHEPNICDWKPGDIVIHDADAKRPDTLMVVTGCSRAGSIARAISSPLSSRRTGAGRFGATRSKPLHDPRRFGIALRGNPEAPLTLTTIRESTFLKS